MDNHIDNTPISDQEKKSFLKSISNASRILILGHYNPDPDCLASQLAIAYILKTHYRKEVRVLAEGSIPEQAHKYSSQLGIQIVNESPLKQNLESFDLVIFADQPRMARSNSQGDTLQSLKPEKAVMIDHHEENISEAPRFSLRIIKYLPSCAEIVYQLFKTEIGNLNEDKSKTISDLILYGIIADSQIFSIQTVSTQTLETVLELSKLGADIQSQIWNFRSKSFAEEISMANMIKKVQIHDLGFTYTFVTPKDLLENDGSKIKILDDFKFELTCIRDFDIHFIFQEKHKIETGFLYELRLRSRQTNILPLAAKLGCAGHQHSAGGRITAKDDTAALQTVSSAYQKFMKSANK